MRTGGWTRGMRGVALGAAFTALTAGCWTSYGGNIQNTRNAATETKITKTNAASLHELWRVSGATGATSTPAVFGNAVYFGAWDGTLRAVSATTGTPLWTRQLNGGIIDDSPLLFGDNLYVGDASGNLHAVDPPTGVVRWTKELDPHPNARIFSSPVGVGDIVIVGVASVELALSKPDYTFRGSVVALDAATGALRWRVYMTGNDAQSGAGVSVWSTAAIDTHRKLAYIGTGNTYEAPASPRSDALMAIDYTTGTVRWVRQFTAGDVYVIFRPPPQGPDADIGAAPNLFRIGDRDVVGVGDKAGVYAVLDRDTGDTIWAKRFGSGGHLGGIMTTAAYDGTSLYLAANAWTNEIDFHNVGNTSTTYALDAATGAVRWQRALPSPVFGAMTYANGVVYQPTVTGTVYALNGSTGAILWSSTPGADLGGGISVANGRVFVPYGFWFFASPANPNGGLVAYGPGSTTAAR